MDTITILHPGHCLCCRNCANRTPDLSHVSPCRLVKWEATRHVKPALVDDWGGAECQDFKAMEPAPAAWQPVAPSSPILGPS